MKKILWCLLLPALLAVSTIASTAPLLVSDPYPAKGEKPAKFLATINGKTVVSMPVKNADGSVYFKYDLSGLPDGVYTVSVKAVDGSGNESPPGVCSFRKTGSRAEMIAPPAVKEAAPPPKEEKDAHGYGPSGQGVRSDACVRFLDKTAGLRKDFERKRHDYWELKRDPKAKPEDLAKIQEEVRALWRSIRDENPENCRWEN